MEEEMNDFVWAVLLPICNAFGLARRGCVENAVDILSKQIVCVNSRCF